MQITMGCIILHLCNGMHYSASCEKVVTVSERKTILEKAGRCFRCLYRGHHIRDCRGPRNCRHCSGQHHQSICTMHETNSLATNRDAKAEVQETPGDNDLDSKHNQKACPIANCACHSSKCRWF